MLSLIVPARNNEAMTRECLAAALHAVNTLGLACEFLLIDDASEPRENILPVFQQLRAASGGHGVRIFRMRERQHYTGVFSLGLSMAAGDEVFFLSNDMVVTPSFLATLRQVAALSPDFGVVRGTSNYVDSHPEHTVPPPGPLRSPAEILAFSAEVARARGGAFTEDKLLSGDAVLIKRALIDRIGVMDLRFFGYFGDVDYGMRAHLAGFRLICAKGAWLLHRGAGHIVREMAVAGETGSAAARARRLALVQAAYGAFRAKWGGALEPDYHPDQPLDYFAMAEQNRAHIALRYDLPAAFADAYEEISAT